MYPTNDNLFYDYCYFDFVDTLNLDNEELREAIRKNATYIYKREDYLKARQQQPHVYVVPFSVKLTNNSIGSLVKPIKSYSEPFTLGMQLRWQNL